MPDDLQRAASDLICCLKKQAQLFGRFLELLTRQRQALASSDSEALSQIAAVQSELLAQTRQVEARRLDLTGVLAEALAALDHSARRYRSAGDLRIAELSRLVEASKASALPEIQYRLRALQEEVDRRRQINSALIEESRRCAIDTLKCIARTTHGDLAGARGRADRSEA